MKMELSGLNFALAAVGFLLWTSGGSAAPMECHFDSRGETPRFKILFSLSLSLSLYIYIYLHSIQKCTLFDCHVLFQHCVCSRGGSSRWVKPGWTTPACSAPVCTLWASVAARREYTDLSGLVSRCPQLLYSSWLQMDRTKKLNSVGEWNQVDVLKGSLCSFGEETQTQNFDIHNINEVKIQSEIFFLS